MEKIQFQPNLPVRMALKFADGKTVEGRFGDQEYFTLTDGRCMYLDAGVASKIYEQSLKPGEPFEICKYWSGKRGESPQWDVRRVDATQDRVSAAVTATGIAESALERDLRRSLEARGMNLPTDSRPGAGVTAPAPIATAPMATGGQSQHHSNGKPNGNGNGNGNHNGHAPVPTPVPAVPVKLPLNVAFREILAFCKQELGAAGEQWSDGARQDLVSTLLIQAAREGWCTIWERGNGHA